MFGRNLPAAQSVRTRSPSHGRPTASEQTQAKRFSTTPTRSALRHYVGPREMALVWLPALPSYAPWLHGHYPLLRYYGRPAPGSPFPHPLPWFPDPRHQTFPPFCLHPSAVLGQTRSTPSTLAALFCSGFAVRSQARQNRRPNRVHSVRPYERTALRTGGSLPVALHPGIWPRCSYFQLLALQCRPGQGLSPCCSSALSGARAQPPRLHRSAPRQPDCVFGEGPNTARVARALPPLDTCRQDCLPYPGASNRKGRPPLCLSLSKTAHSSIRRPLTQQGTRVLQRLHGR